MTNRYLIFSVLFSCFYAQTAVSEENFPSKIDQCVACHGALGQSNYTYFPNLAGQKKTYIVNQLKAFRNGTRRDPWMTPMAVPLNDREIEELAKFYSQL